MSPANALSESTYFIICFRFDKGGTVKSPVMDLPPLPSIQIILLYPHRVASRPGPLNFLRPRSPHPYLLLSEDESSYFRIWLRSHQKPTQGYPSGVPKYSSLLQPTSQRCPHTLSPSYLMSHPCGCKTLRCNIEHRLLWASSAWKVYVRESLYHVGSNDGKPV